MKTMLNPAVAAAGVTGSEAFSLNVLPTLEAFSTDFSFGIMGMRVGVFAAMVAMCAVISIL